MLVGGQSARVKVGDPEKLGEKIVPEDDAVSLLRLLATNYAAAAQATHSCADIPPVNNQATGNLRLREVMIIE